jgi:glucose-fructose oxidoreductase
MNYPRIGSSRREFIRLLALGGAAFAGGAYDLRGQTAMTEKTGRKLGVALLGLGNYATTELAPALRETSLCRLTGVITGVPAKGEKWAEEFGFPKKNVYSYETMDRIADNKEIDIVYVVTPPALHRQYVERAAKAGKHVISEKPMATSVADCDAMIAACKAARVKLSVGYRLHFDPYHRELARLARDKDFGEFTHMTGSFGFPVRSKIWRIDKKLAGGGPMMDVGVYVLHAACMAADAIPASVTAKEQPKKNPELFDSTEETMDWEMTFPNGAVCKASASFVHPSNRFRAEGAKGWIDLQKNAFLYRGIVGSTSRGPLQYPIKRQQAGQMDDFAECVLFNRESSVSGELGRRDLRILTAIYEAAATGKKVSIGEG